MHGVMFHVEHIDRACATSLQALMHGVMFHVEHIDRACATSLQALMHGVPMPAPYSTPLNALYSAGVTRLKITSAFTGAMRMSAKPPLSRPWRGLSPRERDTPASRRAGHARACPKGRAVWSRHGHPTHEHLPFRFACTINMFHVEHHPTHEHLPFRFACTINMFHVEHHPTHEHLPFRFACTIAPLRMQGKPWKLANFKQSPYLRV